MTEAFDVVGDWQVARLAGALGAEVRGIDLRQVTSEEVDRIRSLLLDHLVLFFPDQNISVDDHVSFGRYFGELEGHPHLDNPFTEHPELFELAASRGGVAQLQPGPRPVARRGHRITPKSNGGITDFCAALRRRR